MTALVERGRAVEVSTNRLLTSCCDQADCDCAVDMPREAASSVSGIENEPGYEPRFAYLLEPAFKRWPLGTPLVLCVMLLAALGFVGSLDLQAALAAAN